MTALATFMSVGKMDKNKNNVTQKPKQLIFKVTFKKVTNLRRFQSVAAV